MDWFTAVAVLPLTVVQPKQGYLLSGLDFTALVILNYDTKTISIGFNSQAERERWATVA